MPTCVPKIAAIPRFRTKRAFLRKWERVWSAGHFWGCMTAGCGIMHRWRIWRIYRKRWTVFMMPPRRMLRFWMTRLYAFLSATRIRWCVLRTAPWGIFRRRKNRIFCCRICHCCQRIAVSQCRRAHTLTATVCSIFSQALVRISHMIIRPADYPFTAIWQKEKRNFPGTGRRAVHILTNWRDWTMKFVAQWQSRQRSCVIPFLWFRAGILWFFLRRRQACLHMSPSDISLNRISCSPMKPCAMNGS